MKRAVFLGFVIALTPVLAFAQSSSAPTQPILVATVNIYAAKIVSQQGGTFNISFELSNRQNAQPGVKYAVELLDSKQNVVDEEVYPSVLNLGANTTIPLTVQYAAPSYLSGTYQLTLVSSNTNGLPLAQATLGGVKLSGSGANVAIQPSSCYLQISGDQDNYSLDQGIDIKPSETLSLTCAVQNNSQSSVTLQPSFQTFYRNTFGDQVEAQTPAEPSTSIAAGATKTVTVALPKPSDPQAYDVQVSFSDTQNVPSNSVIAHFVLDGASATIENVTLDQTSYNAGDTAQVTLYWTGVANDFPGARAAPGQLQGTQATVSIVDGTGNSCGQPVTSSLDTTNPQQVISYPISTSCVSPQVSVTLSDSSGTLATSSFSFTTPPGTTPQPQGSNDTWFIIGGILVILIGGYFVTRPYRSNTTSAPKAMLLFVLVSSALLAGGALPQQARADTFGQSVYLDSAGAWSGWYTVDFTANIDNSTYQPGATITATGNAEVGSCANSLYADLRATINGQTKEVTTNYQNNVCSADGSFCDTQTFTQPTTETFTAPTTPGTYDADFYEQLYGDVGSAGDGSFFCLPAGTQGTSQFNVPGSSAMGQALSEFGHAMPNYCEDFGDAGGAFGGATFQPISGVTPPMTSFVATNPYIIPYVVQGATSASSCPDGSAAPNGDPTQCTCAHGNQSACENDNGNTGTNPNGNNNGQCPQGQYSEGAGCVTSCDIGYSLVGNVCTFVSCPVGYTQSAQTQLCTFSSCPQGYKQQTDANGNPECAYTSQCSAGPTCYQGNAYTEDASCTLSNEQVCGWGCSDGQCLPPPTPEIATWHVAPTLVKSGWTTNVDWSAQNVVSCSITGTDGESWSGLTGTEVSQQIQNQTTFTITCQGNPNSVPASVASSTTVYVAPSFCETGAPNCP